MAVQLFDKHGKSTLVEPEHLQNMLNTGDWHLEDPTAPKAAEPQPMNVPDGLDTNPPALPDAVSTFTHDAQELIGSELLPAEIDIAPDMRVTRAEVVLLAFEQSELTPHDWNALEQNLREVLIDQALESLKRKHAEAVDDLLKAAGVSEAVPGVDDLEDQPIDSVAGHAQQAATDTQQDEQRAREADGTFKADDPATPDVNEAWKDGSAPQDAPADGGPIAGATDEKPKRTRKAKTGAAE